MGKYNMIAESLCYNAGADRVASTTANTNFARAAVDRALDGKHWWETYRAAIRIATIEASIRRSTEAVRHKGSDFAKLEINREEGVKRKLDEAISSTTHEHRVYKCTSGWLRCYDCPGRAKPDNKDYWREKPCPKMRKRQRRGPSAEQFKLLQYVLSNPVEHFNLADDEPSNEAPEHQEPIEHQECIDCLTSNEDAAIFFARPARNTCAPYVAAMGWMITGACTACSVFAWSAGETIPTSA